MNEAMPTEADLKARAEAACAKAVELGLLSGPFTERELFRALAVPAHGAQAKAEKKQVVDMVKRFYKDAPVKRQRLEWWLCPAPAADFAGPAVVMSIRDNCTECSSPHFAAIVLVLVAATWGEMSAKVRQHTFELGDVGA
jgi:hypothetical protein